MMSINRFGTEFWSGPKFSHTISEAVPDRNVRFTESFFADLDDATTVHVIAIEFDTTIAGDEVLDQGPWADPAGTSDSGLARR